MNLDELSDASDTSDEDYVPIAKTEDIPSEVDSEGEPEDDLSDSDANKSRKRSKNSNKSKKRLKPEDSPKEPPKPAKILTEAEKQKFKEDLWSDFMKDTGFLPKTAKNEAPTTSDSKKTPATQPKPANKVPDKVKITQVYEFAGEEVKVEKEVAANSAEARLLSQDPVQGKSRGGLSGIGSVLSQIGKKQKISTLEKSKLDWDQFKKEEKIEEELQTHNKGKDGFLDRQDFLQRADLRRFEIEKEVRTIERNKRMNN